MQALHDKLNPLKSKQLQLCFKRHTCFMRCYAQGRETPPAKRAPRKAASSGRGPAESAGGYVSGRRRPPLNPTADRLSTGTSSEFVRKAPQQSVPLYTPKPPTAPEDGSSLASQGGLPTQVEGSSILSHNVSTAGDAPQLRKNPVLYGEVGIGAGPTPRSRHKSTPHGVLHLTKPEVLAPAGGWPQLRAAVENGADAVYFGLTDFNARARAANFEPEELADVMSYLHDRGVLGYVVLNVLVFDEELPAMEQRLRTIAEAGVDAVIVQDLGVVQMIRRVAPALPIHGSTQMSITSPEGVQFAEQLGVSRVVVGRELSVKEIGKVRAGANAEVEAFVHGALCVSYSGQCFSSEAWGGRSANRGQCAQACRMPYGLIVDGLVKELGDMKYLLSPQDLMAVEQVPDLILAGVSCFKIEGRLKGAEYVALTTRLYRQAIDAAWEHMGAEPPQEQTQGPAGVSHGDPDTGAASRVSPPSAVPAVPSPSVAAQQYDAAKEAVQLTQEQMWELEQVFARGQDGEHRGLTPGFLEGVQHQRLVRGRAPRHRGLFLGTVLRADRDGVRVRLSGPIKRGDGVVLDCGDPEQDEQGGPVYEVLDARGRPLKEAATPADGWGVRPKEQEVVLVFKAGQMDARGIQPGDLVWKTKDSALESRLRGSFEGLAASAMRQLPVEVSVSGSCGEPLRMQLRDPEGRTAVAQTAVPLAAASQRALTAEEVARVVGQLGDNALGTSSLDLSGLALEQGLFLPASELKAVRRRAVEALGRLREQHGVDAGVPQKPVLPALLRAAARGSAPHTQQHMHQQEVVKQEASQQEADVQLAEERELSSRGASISGVGPTQPSIRVLCRSRAQVDAALALPWLREVVLDFLEVQGLKEAVVAVRAAGKRAVAATPRVLKPDEQRLWQFYLRLGADALLLRSTGLLQQLMHLGGPGAEVAELGCIIPQLEGDFSLNVANVISADLMLGGGLQRLAPTHDLNAEQICGLARGLGPRAAALEVVLHQHLPIFHTEHCVFCRFLSEGNSYRDCGHPCESHNVHLRDHKGDDHLVLADMGCRNTVFNAQAQSGLFYLPDLLSAGCRTFRVELVDEPAKYVGQLLDGYREVLEGRQAPGTFWRWLGTLPDANGHSHGVAGGSLEVQRERSALSLRPTAAQKREQLASSR